MIRYSLDGATIHIETNALEADIRTEGYTSGVAARSFVDKKTGARDVGFGLSIVDFLLEPAEANRRSELGQYEFGGNYLGVHGAIPKRYVEGPQICTQAKKLPYRVTEGDGFLVIEQWYTWHQAYAPYKAGSRWDQTLIFPEDARYFFSADRVTSVNDCPSLILRVDMPGHVKHQQGDTFEHIYLSYETDLNGDASATRGGSRDQMLPSTDFSTNFAPDSRFLYQRGKQPLPDRFIRAYQVKLGNDGSLGPWLAGMTLEPTDVYEAWCHERGYVCLIEEVGGRPIKAGETFGAAYLVGWFDSIQDMHKAYDKHRGWSGLAVTEAKRPAEFRGVQQQDLQPVPRRTSP